jgi:hypothetical protein
VADTSSRWGSGSFACGVSGMFGALALPIAASAATFDLGIDRLDTEASLDLRYNVGVRTEKRDQAVGNNTLFDEGTYSFDRGEVVTNRFDATGGLTMTYNSDSAWLEAFGLRVSGMAFYDFAYQDFQTQCRPGTAPVGIPPGLFGPTRVDLSFLNIPGLAARASYCDPRITAFKDRSFNDEAKERHLTDLELMDAFVFGSFLVGEVPVNIKAGRHSLYWGEALLNPLLGIGYAMGPIDANKALSVPGVGVQDVFLPIARISASIGLTDTVSIGLDKPLDWGPLRSPEGGSYLAVADPLYAAPDQIYAGNLPILGPLSLPNLPSNEADNDDAFGVQIKWSPDFMAGGSLGLYYRRFGEVVPSLNIAPATLERNPNLIGVAGEIVELLGDLGLGGIGPLPEQIPGGIHLTYPKDSSLIGISAARQIAGISFAGDLAYNIDRGLNAQQSEITEAGKGPRGNVWTGVVNGLYLGKQVSPFGLTLFDSWLLAVEFNGSYLDKVTERPEAYKEIGSAACNADAIFYWAGDIPGGTIDACSSDYHIGIALLFSPIWYQVFPGVDFNGQLFYTNTLKNNSPIQTAGNRGFAIGSLGLTAVFYSNFSVGISYNYYDSEFRTGKNFDDETMVTTFNSAGVIADRDWVSLTMKYSY